MLDAETQPSTQDAAQLARLPTPPVVPAPPLLGSSLELLRDPLGFLREQHAKFGDVFEVRAAHRRFVVLAGVEANRFASREGVTLLESGRAWGPLAEYLRSPHAITAVDGPDHAKVRRHFRRAVSREAVDAHADDVSAIVLRALDECVERDRVSVREWTRRMTNWQVHQLVTGSDQGVPPDVREATFETFRTLANVLMLGKWPRLALLLPGYRRRERRVFAWAEGALAEAARSGANDTWMALVLDGAKREPRLFTQGDCLAAAILPTFAGVDTFGATGTFALRELARNPTVHARLRAEVDAAWDAAGGRLPSADRLRDLPTLHGFCLEVMRLYPVAFGMPRHATQAFAFAGHRIEAGREVLVFTTSTHFDERYFPRPMAFDVDRYGEGIEAHRRPFVYSPYGRGPHACLGAAMSDRMFLITVATVVRHLDLHDPHPGRAYRTVFDPSPTLDFDFVLDVHRRAV